MLQAVPCGTRDRELPLRFQHYSFSNSASRSRIVAPFVEDKKRGGPEYPIRLACRNCCWAGLLRASLINARCEPRFVTRGGVAMNHALLHGLVNRRNSFGQ